jgi:O-antigen ligase
MDESNRRRMDIWNAGMAMLKDRPLGVGPGNFFQSIGRYDATLAGRDAHNTYILCACELGVHGFALWLLLVGSALWTLRRTSQEAAGLPTEQAGRFRLAATAIAASIFVFLTFGLTGSLIYLELFWWLLLLPVCLARALSNVKRKSLPSAAGRETAKSVAGKAKTGRKRTKNG